MLASLLTSSTVSGNHTAVLQAGKPTQDRYLLQGDGDAEDGTGQRTQSFRQRASITQHIIKNQSCISNKVLCVSPHPFPSLFFFRTMSRLH